MLRLSFYLRFLILALFVPNVGACTSNSPSLPPEPAGGLPDLESLPLAPRKVSATTLQLTEQDVVRARGLSWNGSQMTIGGETALSYVIFGLSEPAAYERLRIVPTYSDGWSASNGPAWLFISDFSVSHWQFVGSLDSHSVGWSLDAGPYANEEGTLYIAVIGPAEGGSWWGELHFMHAAETIAPPPDIPEDAIVPPDIQANYEALLDFVADGDNLLPWVEQGSVKDRRAAMYYTLQYDNIILSDLGIMSVDDSGKLDIPVNELIVDAAGIINSRLEFSYDIFYIELPTITRGQLAWFGELLFERHPNVILSISTNQFGGPPP